MKILMFDTNVVFDLMYHEKKTMAKLADYSTYDFAISILVYAEVMAGAQLRVKQDTRKFLQRFKICNFDAKAHTVAKIFLDKYFTGREKKPMDLLIAAHAKSLNVPVITNNARDFIFKEVQVVYYEKSFWS